MEPASNNGFSMQTPTDAVLLSRPVPAPLHIPAQGVGPTDAMEAETSNYCQSGINSVGTGSRSGFDYTPSISPSLSDQRMSYSPTGSAFFSVKSGYSAASPSAISEDEQILDAIESVRKGSILHERGNFLQLHETAAEPWASISYYELNCRVGETFKVRFPLTTITMFAERGA